jgi:ubiquinol-cytochrome c reductase iron-sulfur subunit
VRGRGTAAAPRRNGGGAHRKGDVSFAPLGAILLRRRAMMSLSWTRLAPRALRRAALLPRSASTAAPRVCTGTPGAAPRAAGPAGLSDSRDRYGQARELASKAASASPPTISSAGIIGPGDPASNTGPGALVTGYADDYHNHSHRSAPGDPTKRAFTYMVLGTTKFIAASAARLLVLKLIYTMSASADVLAKGSVEVDLAAIPLGTTATLKWRGKPVFIRHRNDAEIALAAKDDNADLRDPETDLARVQKPEWLIVLGVCTHLGCVPIAGAGDFGGWFCPCHGSHYDVSGRTRKGVCAAFSRTSAQTALVIPLSSR